MKMKMCRCKWSALVRPRGPIKIEKTELKSTDGKSNDIMVAKLGGAVRAEVAVVREGEKYYFKGPAKLGGTTEVPADSLTDAMNYRVWELGEQAAKKKGIKTGETPRTRGHAPAKPEPKKK